MLGLHNGLYIYISGGGRRSAACSRALYVGADENERMDPGWSASAPGRLDSAAS
jgi:hypothetical protein